MSFWNDPSGCSFGDPVEEEVLACVDGRVQLDECWTSEYVHVAAEDSSLSDEQERDLR